MATVSIDSIECNPPGPEAWSYPDLSSAVPAHDWFDGRAALHRDRAAGDDPLGVHLLCAARLARVARGLRGQHDRGVLASAPARLVVPAATEHESPLAAGIAAEGALLYPYDTAVRRLAAAALFGLAAEAERSGSADADEFVTVAP